MSIKKNEVNYTSEMVSEIAAMTPINLEKAKELSVLLNRSVRSIIAKTKREGIDYISVKPAAKRVKGKTKAELVEAISQKDGSSGFSRCPFHHHNGRRSGSCSHRPNSTD